MFRRVVVVYVVVLAALSGAFAGFVWFFPDLLPGHTSPIAPTATAPAGLPTAPTEGPAAEAEDPGLPPGVRIHFNDVTSPAGIKFHHDDGRTEMEFLMDSTGSGVGWLDYDQDGLMDLFLVQGSDLQPSGLPVAPGAARPCALYHNLGGGRFQDVTSALGLGPVGCGQGVAVGDYDNDGFPDLFVTCYGSPNHLFHNEPDGHGGRHFVDVTTRAGLASRPEWDHWPNWSTSAAFLDYDGDGKLDLFVCTYVRVDPAHYPECRNPATGKRNPCPPWMFEGGRCVLYRNNGDGTFTDVSAKAGVDQPNAKSLGVVALDLNGDGKTDLFVANDGAPNFLFLNRGDGTFESVGPSSGCAANNAGDTQAYMGVDADDLDGDGLPDLFVTAYSRETNTFFRNLGGGQFSDMTAGSGLGPPSWYRLAFGTTFLDPDNDGNLDIVVVNGHVARHIDDEGNPNITFREPAQFYHKGQATFRDLSPWVGPYFSQPHVGRGLAAADYDNDGRMDLAISNSGEDAALLHNESVTPYHWLRLELRGTTSNRDAVGARVSVRAGGRELVRHRKGGGSYLSAHDPRLLIGLGSAERAEAVEVRWPSGLVQKFGPLDAGRGYLLVEGNDKVEARP